MYIQAHECKQDGDKLKSLLITKKKYNGLNLACILLEQMILDNKDNNVSWMRIICTQFIDLVCHLIIESDYQEDVRWTLNYLLKLESVWSVADVYNLMRNGILMFQYRQDFFHRYLIRIRNFAVDPSMDVCISNSAATVRSKSILYFRNKIKLTGLKNKTGTDVEKRCEEDEEESLDQVLKELNEYEVGRNEQDSIKQIIDKSKIILEHFRDKYEQGIKRELYRIKNSEHIDGVDELSSYLAVTSMAMYIFNIFEPSNTQIVSYCLLVDRKMTNKGRLLEILTGEGKSCVIAMVAATNALMGRTVDIVTSSSVLSQLDAEKWKNFYKILKLDVSCNAQDNISEDSQCYICPIVYGTVETFARDILKSEFLLQDVRNGRKCDIVIVDEVDSMLIDQGVQCTYLSQNNGCLELRHFEPILALIWTTLSMFFPVHNKQDIVCYITQPEVFFVTLTHLRNGVDPFQILRLAEENETIPKGFTDSYRCKDIESQKETLRSIGFVHIRNFFLFALDHLNLDVGVIYSKNAQYYNDGTIYEFTEVSTRLSILIYAVTPYAEGLSSIVFPVNMLKARLTKMIIDVISNETKTGINLPIHLRGYCHSRMRSWIDSAFLAQTMRQGREYVVRDIARFIQLIINQRVL